MRYKNYKVMVTGATSGIGLAITKRFIDEGAKVIGMGRNFDKTKELGDSFIPFKCDVTDVTQIMQAVEFVKKEFDDELDCLINCAGIGVTGTVTTVTSEDVDGGVALLLKPVLLFSKELYGQLKKSPNNNASIVNIASLASRLFNPDVLMYSATKHAVVHCTKHQAIGFAGVRCNSVSPGYIDTPGFTRGDAALSQETVDSMFAGLESIIPSHRIGKPDEIASVVAFVCSEDAKYITGADFLVDGGASLKVV